MSAASFRVAEADVTGRASSDTGWEPTPWHATQRAAWEAMKRPMTESRPEDRSPPKTKRNLRLLGLVFVGLAIWNGVDAMRPLNPLAKHDGIKALLFLVGALFAFWLAARKQRPTSRSR